MFILSLFFCIHRQHGIIIPYSSLPIEKPDRMFENWPCRNKGMVFAILAANVSAGSSNALCDFLPQLLPQEVHTQILGIDRGYIRNKTAVDQLKYNTFSGFATERE
jgi:hypothetical protein